MLRSNPCVGRKRSKYPYPEPPPTLSLSCQTTPHCRFMATPLLLKTCENDLTRRKKLAAASSKSHFIGRKCIVVLVISAHHTGVTHVVLRILALLTLLLLLGPADASHPGWSYDDIAIVERLLQIRMRQTVQRLSTVTLLNPSTLAQVSPRGLLRISPTMAIAKPSRTGLVVGSDADG